MYIINSEMDCVVLKNLLNKSTFIIIFFMILKILYILNEIIYSKL